MWKSFYILSKIIKLKIFDTIVPKIINLKNIYNDTNIKNKEIFVVNREMLSGLTIHSYDLKPYNITNDKATINPYYLDRVSFTNVNISEENCPIPMLGGTKTVNIDYPVDFIPIIGVNSNGYVGGGWNFAYRAKLYINDIFVGNITTESGMHLPPETKQTKGSLSGNVVNSSFMFITIPESRAIKITVKDPEFYGGLHSDGTLYISMSLSRISDDSTTRKPCNVDVFVFGSI